MCRAVGRQDQNWEPPYSLSSTFPLFEGTDIRISTIKPLKEHCPQGFKITGKWYTRTIQEKCLDIFIKKTSYERSNLPDSTLIKIREVKATCALGWKLTWCRGTSITQSLLYKYKRSPVRANEFTGGIKYDQVEIMPYCQESVNTKYLFTSKTEQHALWLTEIHQYWKHVMFKSQRMCV